MFIFECGKRSCLVEGYLSTDLFSVSIAADIQLLFRFSQESSICPPQRSSVVTEKPSHTSVFHFNFAVGMCLLISSDCMVGDTPVLTY